MHMHVPFSGVARAARVTATTPSPETHAAERADPAGAASAGDVGSHGDALWREDVPLNLSLPDADWWGDWVDAELEGAYRRESMLPDLGTYFMRGAVGILCISTLFAIVSYVSFGVGFKLTLAATSWVIALCGVLFALVQRRLKLSLGVVEAAIIALLVVFTSVPITPERLANLLERASDAVQVRVESEADMLVVTMRFAIVLFYCAIFIPLRPRRFGVFIGCSWLAQVSQQLLLAPGSTAANVRDSLSISLAMALAFHARQHIFKIDRAQWHFHRRVRGAMLERTEQERAHVRERLELAEVRAGKEARSRLIRVAMHDLRSPLLSLHSISQALQARDQAQPLSTISEVLGMLGALSQLMEAVVSDMLDFERIDSGRITLVKQPFCISEVLDNARATFAAVAAAEGVELRIEPLPDDLAAPRRFEGDARRLSQALNNGCSNAIKFTDRGGAVTVRAWCAPSSPAEATPRARGRGWHEVHIDVVDTGAGLSAAELRTLQDGGIFTQVGRGQLQGNGGTGLGLSIAKELLKLHDNSELRLRSDGEGKGTHFEMVLMLRGAPPLAHPDSAGVRPAHAAVPGATADGDSDLSRRGRLSSLLASIRPRGAPFTEPIGRRTSAPAREDGESRSSAPDRVQAARTPPHSDPLTDRDLVKGGRRHPARANPPSLQRRLRGGADGPAPADARGGGERGTEPSGAADPSAARKARAASGHWSAQFGAHSRSAASPPGSRGGVLAPRAARGSVGSTAPGPSASEEGAHGVRCLHVEDDKFVQMTLPLSTFELVGVEYDTADDGEQAVQMAAARRYDLVLMDNQMPKLTGAQAARELRRRGFTGRIIGITGDPEGSEDRREFEQSGLDACVDKTSDGTDFIVQELRTLAAAAAELARVSTVAEEQARAPGLPSAARDEPEPAAAASAETTSHPHCCA